MVYSVAQAEHEHIGQAAVQFETYIKQLNVRKIKGTKYGLGDILRPVFQACAATDEVRKSTNKEKAVLDCVVEVLGIARLYLLQNK